MPDISLLERREIQAPLAACIIREFARVLGRARALDIAAAAVGAFMGFSFGLDSVRKESFNVFVQQTEGDLNPVFVPREQRLTRKAD